MTPDGPPPAARAWVRGLGERRCDPALTRALVVSALAR